MSYVRKNDLCSLKKMMIQLYSSCGETFHAKCGLLFGLDHSVNCFPFFVFVFCFGTIYFFRFHKPNPVVTRFVGLFVPWSTWSSFHGLQGFRSKVYMPVV